MITNVYLCDTSYYTTVTYLIWYIDTPPIGTIVTVLTAGPAATTLRTLPISHVTLYEVRGHVNEVRQWLALDDPPFLSLPLSSSLPLFLSSSLFLSSALPLFFSSSLPLKPFFLSWFRHN